MRMLMSMALVLTLMALAWGQSGGQDKGVRRYGMDVDSKKFPQTTPKDALASVLKAIAAKQFDYLLAHLVDPAFVDERVAQNVKRAAAGLSADQKQTLAFEELSKSVADNYLNDPTKFKELQRFGKEGEWTDNGKDAVASLKGLTARKVFMKLIAPERWVLMDREK